MPEPFTGELSTLSRKRLVSAGSKENCKVARGRCGWEQSRTDESLIGFEVNDLCNTCSHSWNHGKSEQLVCEKNNIALKKTKLQEKENLREFRTELIEPMLVSHVNWKKSYQQTYWASVNSRLWIISKATVKRKSSLSELSKLSQSESCPDQWLKIQWATKVLIISLSILRLQ